MGRKNFDEEKHLLSSAMEGPECKSPSVSIEMEDKQKTKEEFSREGYAMDREKMGICYIINNVDREQPATRRDVRKAEEVFTNLGFDVKLYLNQTKEEMSAIRNNQILNDENYKDCNCLVILIIAHGSNKRNVFEVGGRTAWNLDVLEEQIARIKPLEGRPKLLFVEACRGQRQHNVAMPPNSKTGTEDMQVSKKEIEEEVDEDFMKLKQSGWVAPFELGMKNAGMDNGALDVDEKTKKMKRGAVAAINTQVSTMENNELEMPAKRDQFIGLSTVENYVAFTVNTSGSPYLQHLLRQLNEGAFLDSLQAIHQITRQEVGKEPIHEHRYMVPDEHNRLHADLCFRNHLLCPQNKPLMKGSVSHESTVTLLGVTYNIFEHCADAHQVFNSGDKIPAPINTKLHLQVPENRLENEEQSKCFYDLPKGSMVQNSEESPRTYMEILRTPLEYFSKTNDLLINTENKCYLDLPKISERWVLTKPCPGFNIIENTEDDETKYAGPGKHMVTFYKEYPMFKISLGREHQEMLFDMSTDKNLLATKFDCPSVFKTWIEKCPIHISIEDIQKDISKEQDGGTKQKIENFRLLWEHYFGKFGGAQKVKEIVSSFPGIKEFYSDGNSRHVTKAPSTKFLIDCGDFFVNFECPKSMQNGDVPNFKDVKLEELSKEEAEEKKETYKQFLNYWGHYFVSEFYVGGSITLKLLLTNDDLKDAAQIKEYLNKFCSGEDIEHKEPELKVIDVQFKGGNIDYHKKSFDEVDAKQIMEWKESLQTRPTPLMSKVTILPVHLAVACLDPERGEIVRQTSEELQQNGKDWTTKYDSCNDTKYIGESAEEKPHGKGTLKCRYETYTGSFKKGSRCGYGKCHFTQDVSTFAKNMSDYSGEWMDDKPQGNGTGHFKKGDVYIGQWKNGKPEGLGTVYYEDGSEATILCRGGHVEEVLKGAVKDLQIGTEYRPDPPKISKMKKAVDETVKWFNMLGKCVQKLIIAVVLLLLFFIIAAIVGVGFAITESLRDPTCTETMLAKWKNVSQYDYVEAGFLDVDVFRLNSSSHKAVLACQQSNLVMDLFPISSEAEEERLSNLCRSNEIVPRSTYEFDNANKLHVTQRLYGKNIVRFRTCDPKYCSNKDIGCTSVQKFKPLTCLQALSNQWDEIAEHNSTDNTLTVNMGLLNSSIKDLCKLDSEPVNVEMFAVSTRAGAEFTEFYSCKSFPNHWVLPFRPKMILNETSLETFKYVSGSFVVRFSRGETQVCTYPKRVYGSQSESNIMDIWESETCTQIPNVIAGTAAKIEDDACIFTVSSFPFLDCYIMDKTLTAIMKLKLLNETQGKCDDPGTFIEDVANITRKSADDRIPILGDVSFSLPMNATFCLEGAVLNYPLCPTINKADEDKCSRPVGVPMELINCEKQWVKKQK